MQDLLTWIDHTGLGNIIWATDLDLTVLDKQPDPSKISAPAGLEASFRSIDALTNDRFYIITGREKSYVDGLFPGSTFKLSAEYHNMVRFAPPQPHHEPNPRPQWGLIDKNIETLVQNFQGMVLRKKPFMRTIHYTHAPSLKNQAIKTQVADALQMLLDRHEHLTGQKLENIDGGSVFDMAPYGSSKKTAYEDILSLHKMRGEDNLVPLYFGDSPGDLPAALVVRQNGGKFVLVGDDARMRPYADFTLQNPQECRDLFAQIAGLSPQQNRPQPAVTATPKAPGNH